MTRYIPDDRRYMTFEERAKDDARYRGTVKRERAITVCYCGKTVTHVDGAFVAACPRECEAHRPKGGGR